MSINSHEIERIFIFPAHLQQAIDELLKVYATTPVGIELCHEASQLVLGQIDVEPLEHLRCNAQQSVHCDVQCTRLQPTSSNSFNSTLPLLSRSSSSNDLRNSPPEACEDSRCAIFVRSI
jgi:hypothetical protein